MYKRKNCDIFHDRICNLIIKLYISFKNIVIWKSEIFKNSPTKLFSILGDRIASQFVFPLKIIFRWKYSRADAAKYGTRRFQ